MAYSAFQVLCKLEPEVWKPQFTQEQFIVFHHWLVHIDNKADQRGAKEEEGGASLRPTNHIILYTLCL